MPARDVATRAADSDRLERAFRAHAVAAQLAQRGRDAALARTLEPSARAPRTPRSSRAAAPAFRAALDADPDLARLPAASAPRRARSPRRQRRAPAPAAHAVAPAQQRGDVERILDEVIDTAIELTAAERGFLLLRQRRRRARAGRVAQLRDGRSRERRALGQPLDRRARRADRRAGRHRRRRRRRALRGRGVGRGAAPALGARRAAAPARRDHRLHLRRSPAARRRVRRRRGDAARRARRHRGDRDRERAPHRRSAPHDARGRRAQPRGSPAELAERDAELVRVKADLPDRAAAAQSLRADRRPVACDGAHARRRRSRGGDRRCRS